MASRDRSLPRRSAPPITAGLVIFTLLALSLVPAFADLRTGIPGELEHFAAYLVSAAVFSTVTAGRSLSIVVGFCLVAVVLESLQAFVPERGPEIVGALAGCVGAACGVSIVQYASRWRKKRAQHALSKGHMP